MVWLVLYGWNDLNSLQFHVFDRIKSKQYFDLMFVMFEYIYTRMEWMWIDYKAKIIIYRKSLLNNTDIGFFAWFELSTHKLTFLTQTVWCSSFSLQFVLLKSESLFTLHSIRIYVENIHNQIRIFHKLNVIFYS